MVQMVLHTFKVNGITSRIIIISLIFSVSHGSNIIGNNNILVFNLLEKQIFSEIYVEFVKRKSL